MAISVYSKNPGLQRRQQRMFGSVLDGTFDYLWNRAFNDIFGDHAILGETKSITRDPMIYDTIDYDDRKEIIFAVPLRNEDNLEVKVDGDIVSISGEKISTEDIDNNGGMFSQRRLSRHAVYAAYDVGSWCKMDEITATFKDGTLKLVLPRKEILKDTSRRIEIIKEE